MPKKQLPKFKTQKEAVEFFETHSTAPYFDQMAEVKDFEVVGEKKSTQQTATSKCSFILSKLSNWRCPHPAQHSKSLCRWHDPAVNKTRTQIEQAVKDKADLVGADLTGANLWGAVLVGANLTGANLVVADLTGANLRGAVLRGADLVGANLWGAVLTGADLTGADLTEADLGWTTFASCDLSEVKGLEAVTHHAPSTIGIDTLYKSKGLIPKAFFKGAGVPDIFITYVDALVNADQPFQFYSCFISYSHQDEQFAQRLYRSLQEKEIRCWLFPEDATFGRKIWGEKGEVDQVIRRFDKTLVICSASSLQSEPVLREIEITLQREQEDGEEHLFPIRLDNYVFAHWEHPSKAAVLSRVIADFSPGQDYDKQLGRLLRALETSRKQVLAEG